MKKDTSYITSKRLRKTLNCDRHMYLSFITRRNHDKDRECPDSQDVCHLLDKNNSSFFDLE